MSDNLKVAKECGSLLPCPFCGSIPRREVKNDILIIECPSCVSVGFHNHVRFGCRADEEWNSRILASQQAAHDAEIAELKESWNDLRGFLERTQKELSVANERIAYLEGLVALQTDALKEIEWAVGDFDRGGECVSYCPSCGGAQYQSFYTVAGHKEGCKLQSAISASAETVQAFLDKLTEPLRREVANLWTELRSLVTFHQSINLPAAQVAHAIITLENHQATAQACEQEVEARGAVKALEEARADNGRGFSLWFSREEWGGIIDGLGLEIARSGGRKKTNSESTSDVRMTMCERIIAAINNASELRTTSKKAG